MYNIPRFSVSDKVNGYINRRNQVTKQDKELEVKRKFEEEYNLKGQYEMLTYNSNNE